MESLDLNIDNYEFKDILELFQIPIDFGEIDLKKAKKKVLMMHPDKSSLDKKYFLFFSAAYKILFSIYEFREKANASEKLDITEQNTEYLATKDENHAAIIDSLKSTGQIDKNFNKWFNNLFEKVKIQNEYEDNGYGDWFKSNEDDADTSEQCNSQQAMNEAIDKRKKFLRDNSLTKYNNVQGFNDANYCDLTNSKPDEYSSDVFSKLQYGDLKKSHEESVVPVTNDDYKPRYSSMDDIKFQRAQQNIIPLTEQENKQLLNSNEKNETNVNSNRAFRLAKQQQEAELANKKWWSSLKQITNN